MQSQMNCIDFDETLSSEHLDIANEYPCHMVSVTESHCYDEERGEPEGKARSYSHLYGLEVWGHDRKHEVVGISSRNEFSQTGGWHLP